jgi:catechol 2,3-dioxygenase-like lactoylglutathione lyase family enzyme
MPARLAAKKGRGLQKTIFPVASLVIGILASVAAACTTVAPATLPAAPLASTLPTSSPALPATATAIIPATSTPLPVPSTTPTPPPTATATNPATSRAAPSSAPTAAAAASDFTTTGAFFALSVADVNASAQWYSEKLGLKVVLRPPKTDQSTVVELEGGGLIVELIQVDGSRPLAAVAPGLKSNLLVHGIVKVGAIVDDFDQTVAMLRQRHVTLALGPFPASADQRANIIVQDNDGNLIQFFGK